MNASSFAAQMERDTQCSFISRHDERPLDDRHLQRGELRELVVRRDRWSSRLGNTEAEHGAQ